MQDDNFRFKFSILKNKITKNIIIIIAALAEEYVYGMAARVNQMDDGFRLDNQLQNNFNFNYGDNNNNKHGMTNGNLHRQLKNHLQVRQNNDDKENKTRISKVRFNLDANKSLQSGNIKDDNIDINDGDNYNSLYNNSIHNYNYNSNYNDNTMKILDNYAKNKILTLTNRKRKWLIHLVFNGLVFELSLVIICFFVNLGIVMYETWHMTHSTASTISIILICVFVICYYCIECILFYKKINNEDFTQYASYCAAITNSGISDNMVSGTSFVTQTVDDIDDRVDTEMLKRKIPWHQCIEYNYATHVCFALGFTGMFCVFTVFFLFFFVFFVFFTVFGLSLHKTKQEMIATASI